MIIARRKRTLRATFAFLTTLVLLAGCLFALNVRAATFVPSTGTVNPTDEQIQKALDQLTEGGDLVLPAGAYEIHHPIILRHDGQTLRGSGITTMLHLADRANCPVIILGSPDLQRVTAHLRLADLCIDGNRANQQLEFWRAAADGSQLNNNGIDVWNVNDAVVERVVCRSCRSGGLVTAVTRRLNVRNFTAFDNQFDGLACYFTEESHFTGLNLHDNLAAGISLDLSFNHNVINDAVLTGNDIGIFMRQACDNSFHGLTISKSRKYGVFMAQTAESSPKGWALVSGTECTGNNFDGLVISDYGRDPFLIHNLSCKNNVIHDAHFLKNSHAGGIQTVINSVNVLDLIHP